MAGEGNLEKCFLICILNIWFMGNFTKNHLRRKRQAKKHKEILFYNFLRWPSLLVKGRHTKK